MEELELTYLVQDLPDGVKASKSKEMLDIYLPASSHHPTLRIRRTGNKYEMTKKEPIDGDATRQLENTIPLTEAEYKDLETLPGKRTYKTRYYYTENGIEYEVAVFTGDLAGLITADVEFKSVKEKDAFTPPAWCYADVSQETFLAGGMLCGKKYADLEKDLKKFNYKKQPAQ